MQRRPHAVPPSDQARAGALSGASWIASYRAPLRPRWLRIRLTRSASQLARSSPRASSRSASSNARSARRATVRWAEGARRGSGIRAAAPRTARSRSSASSMTPRALRRTHSHATPSPRWTRSPPAAVSTSNRGQDAATSSQAPTSAGIDDAGTLPRKRSVTCHVAGSSQRASPWAARYGPSARSRWARTASGTARAMKSRHRASGSPVGSASGPDRLSRVAALRRAPVGRRRAGRGARRGHG
jgi:hypothetical protein